MEPKPIKRCSSPDEKTKPKQPPGQKLRGDSIGTKTLRDVGYNQLAARLISESGAISEESSAVLESEEELAKPIDVLYVVGAVSNVRQVTKDIKEKYEISSGLSFELENYVVVFAGRHQVGFRDGLTVGLYAPPAFRSAPDPATKKTWVLINRKLGESMDPMQYPYVVIDPYNQLYPTYICTWIECRRKITLEHYIQYNQVTNEAMTLGNAIHRYLEWLIRKEVPYETPEQPEVRRLYESFLYEMYLLNMSFETFAGKIEQGIVNLVSWYEEYVVKGHTIELNKWDKKYLKITRTLGSEVMVKSKYFGIRGKVDGLFEGEYWDEKIHARYPVVIPFELKTGKKQQDQHRKQTQFYNLLLREDKNMAVLSLLYYSELNLVEHRAENPLSCFENINVHRNKIIVNILNLFSEPTVLRFPSLPDSFDQCQNCNVYIECAVGRLQPQQLKDIEDCAEPSPEQRQPHIMQQLKKMSVLQFAYLRRWTEMLHLEQCEQKMVNLQNAKKHYYSKIQTQAQGLDRLLQRQSGQTAELTLRKRIDNHEMSEQIENYFKVGEKLRIFIPEIRLADSCRIAKTDKTTKVFTMVVEIKNDDVKFNRGKCATMVEFSPEQWVRVQLERYENSFYGYTRGYCYRFVATAEPWAKQIVIQQTYQEKESKKLELSQPEMENLNDHQRLAFSRCATMQRFCLVQGMPGTGKTELIIKLIQYFYRIGKKVLVTSFTNQALANILDREIKREKKIPPEAIIREGSRFGIAGEYEYLSSQSQSQGSIDDYRLYFEAKKVWFVTISSLYIQHLPKEKFDVVIVDEASQCLEANCLEALVKADKFVLIGDERQLQPVVKSKKAVERGMQISLFQRLCTKYPQFLVKLKKQYRMSPRIMNLTNSLVYGGQLELGHPSIQTRRLQIDQQWQQIVPEYMHPIIDPALSLRLINYDDALNLFSSREVPCDIRKIKRLIQIRTTCLLYKYFRELGVDRNNILIISAYNSLVHQLVSALRKEGLIDFNQSDVLTIDKSQGTDKEVIIFIFHQGNKDLIENYRRMNVAITRAKNKFIIVGSHSELSNLETWTGRLAQLLIPDQVKMSPQFLQGILEGQHE